MTDEQPKIVLIKLLCDQPHGKRGDEVVVSEFTADILCRARGTAERVVSKEFPPALLLLTREAQSLNDPSINS